MIAALLLALGAVHQPWPPAAPPPVVSQSSRVPAGASLKLPRANYNGRMEWNFEGQWNPTREFMVKHLLNPQFDHYAKFEPWERALIPSLSRSQLIDIHDSHEDAGHSPIRKNARATATAPFSAGSATSQRAAPVRASSSVSSCPGGVCPTNTGGGFLRRILNR